jgi:hypothetical protein
MFYAWDQSWKVILCMVGIAGICHHTLFFLIVVFFFLPRLAFNHDPPVSTSCRAGIIDGYRNA